MIDDVDSETVATVPKNTLDEIRVGLSDFRGHRLLDVRVFTQRGRTAGDYVPTQKGISVNVDQLEALRAALGVAANEARRKGWLAGRPPVRSIELVRPPAP